MSFEIFGMWDGTNWYYKIYLLYCIMKYSVIM